MAATVGTSLALRALQWRGRPAARMLTVETVQTVIDRLRDVSPAAELADSMMPLHLGDTSGGVWELVERVTRDPRLDHGHRRGERSWHFAGQRLLSIRKSGGGTVVTAGIHYSGPKAPRPVVLPPGDHLSSEQVADIIRAIEQAIEERRMEHRRSTDPTSTGFRRSSGVTHPSSESNSPPFVSFPRGAHETPSRRGAGVTSICSGWTGMATFGSSRPSSPRTPTIFSSCKGSTTSSGRPHMSTPLVATRGGQERPARTALRPRRDGWIGKVQGVALHHASRHRTRSDAVQWRFQTVRDWFQQPDLLEAVDSKISAPFEVLFE